MERNSNPVLPSVIDGDASEVERFHDTEKALLLFYFRKLTQGEHYEVWKREPLDSKSLALEEKRPVPDSHRPPKSSIRQVSEKMIKPASGLLGIVLQQIQVHPHLQTWI